MFIIGNFEPILFSGESIICKIRKIIKFARVVAAIKSCPSNALNILMHQLPINIFTRTVTASSAIRLNNLGGCNIKELK